MGNQPMGTVGGLSADVIVYHVFRILAENNAKSNLGVRIMIYLLFMAFVFISFVSGFWMRCLGFSCNLSIGCLGFFSNLLRRCLMSGAILMRCCFTPRGSRGSEGSISIAARPVQGEAVAAPVMQSQGLDKSTVGSLPLVGYSRMKGLKGGKDLSGCAVCLNGFEEDENLRLLPTCGHVFHPDCIDMWFHSHATCPLCRSSVVPSDSPSEQFQNWITSSEMVLDGEASTIHAGPPVPPNASILELLPREGAQRILAESVTITIGEPA